MKITKPIVWLSAVVSGFISVVAYSLIVPAINSGGECVTEYNPFAVSGQLETCKSLIGVEIPMWWQAGSETVIPISLLFGVFCGAVVALALLVRMQFSVVAELEK